MRIEVKEVSKGNDGRVHVTFASRFGGARADWKGPQPEPNNTYEVETEVDAILTWGDAIREIDNKTPEIRMLGNRVLLHGILERQEEDCAYVRIGDSVVTIETKGKAPSAGQSVCIDVERLLLYDVRL